MLERLRNRLGPAGLIVSIMALVLAVAGGAYAASGALTGKQKKEVKNIAKQYAGKPGAQGATGPAGPAGPKGDNGSPGTNGTDGTDGVDGTDGDPGPAGPTGPKGDPWTAGGTLPPGETLTGVWGVYNQGGEGVKGVHSLPITFPIPLAEAPEEIVYLEESEPSNESCPGIVDGIPTAEPGKLCVYAQVEREEVDIVDFNYAHPADESSAYGYWASGSSPMGTLMRLNCKATFCYLGGYWAVTAAEA